jgi:hypothetical protein
MGRILSSDDPQSRLLHRGVAALFRDAEPGAAPGAPGVESPLAAADAVGLDADMAGISFRAAAAGALPGRRGRAWGGDDEPDFDGMVGLQLHRSYSPAAASYASDDGYSPPGSPRAGGGGPHWQDSPPGSPRRRPSL